MKRLLIMLTGGGVTDLVKLRIDAVRIYIDKQVNIITNATDYNLITREDTSIIMNINT